MIHNYSDRHEAPFVAVNCGAIPGELAASLLFGHAKGAFTGADTARQGYFDLAKGGTLFLDEIGTLPYSVQSVLLRVLQEKHVHTCRGQQGKTCGCKNSCGHERGYSQSHSGKTLP